MCWWAVANVAVPCARAPCLAVVDEEADDGQCGHAAAKDHNENDLGCGEAAILFGFAAAAAAAAVVAAVAGVAALTVADAALKVA